MSDDDAPGWQAITGALARVYPGREPDFQFGMVLVPGISVAADALELPGEQLAEALGALRYRLPFGRELWAVDGSHRVRFVPGEWAWSVRDDGVLELRLPADALPVLTEALSAGRAPAGWAGLTIRTSRT